MLVFARKNGADYIRLQSFLGSRDRLGTLVARVPERVLASASLFIAS